MKDFSVRSSKKIYSGPVFNLFKEEVVLPNDQVVERDVVRHPGAVVILPLAEDQSVYFVRQYRHAIGRSILELPAGTLETGELALDCAKREISEEVGFAANSWHDLGQIFTAPGFCDETQYTFLATDLYPRKLPGDEDEILEIESYPFSEVPELIKRSEIVDAKSIAVFYKAYISGMIV